MMNNTATYPEVFAVIGLTLLLVVVIGLALFGAYLWAKSHDMRATRQEDGSILISAIKARDHASIPLEVQPEIVGVDMAAEPDRSCWYRINADGGFDHLPLPSFLRPQADVFKRKDEKNET